MRARSRSRRSSASASPTARADGLGELKLKISGLHQCLRPSPCRQHRHSRRRQERHRELPAAARRLEAPKTLRPAKITGPGFDEDGIVDAVEKATDVYLAQRQDGERFLDTYRRIGMEPFKEAIYA